MSITKHLGLTTTLDEIESLTKGEISKSNSKNPREPFNIKVRQNNRKEQFAKYRMEIREAMTFANKIMQYFPPLPPEGLGVAQNITTNHHRSIDNGKSFL